MQYAVLIASLAIGAIATPAPMITPAPVARDIQKRFDLPASSGSSALSEVYTVASGETFDGGYVMYDRGVDCEGQTEGGDSDAVFQIENGGTLKNVIIGPNQMEGVHCQGACTLENVWWSAVCEVSLRFTGTVCDEWDVVTDRLFTGRLYHQGAVER